MLLLYLISTFLFIPKLSLQNVHCRDKDRPISNENADSLELVDATPGQNITLECHYCFETDDGEPKNWYKTNKPGLERAKEVVPDMENKMELNRIRVNSDHSLNIHNVSENDTGLYYCKKYLEENVVGKFNYFVDLVIAGNSKEMESGNLTDWSKYHDEYMSPINMLLQYSMGLEYLKAKEQLLLTMELFTHWGKWGVCDACGRPQGEAIKKKVGKCRIRLRNEFKKNRTLPSDELLLLSVNEISCRSVKFENVFPGISNLTKTVPDFVQLEKCDAICNPDKDGENAGWKVGKSKGFKYRKTFVLLENSHLTLVCPESTLENKVTWQKRGKTLRPGDASW